MSDLSGPATDGIRNFSRWTWVIGTVVATALAALTMPAVVWDADTGQVIVDPGQYYPEARYPWLSDDALELTIADGQISGGSEGGYIPLPAGSSPLKISVHGDSSVGVSQTSDATWEPGEWSELLGYFYSGNGPVYVVPGDTDGRLWFDSYRGDWTVSVTPLEPEQIGIEHSGTGDAVLEYRGDALSARFTHDGKGIFSVTVATWGEHAEPINGIDEVDVRASWKKGGSVLFVIDAADATGTWTVTVNE